MSKLIPLTGKLGVGRFAIVDDRVYPLVSPFKWYLGKVGYAASRRGKKHSDLVYLHDTVVSFSPLETDHRNGNKLDCRRRNLRPATHQQNAANRGKQINNTSGFKGVSFEKSRRQWVAQLRANGRRVLYKRFSTRAEAVDAYASAVKFHCGEFAHV